MTTCRQYFDKFIYFCRNKRGYACSDEFSSEVMEGLQIINGLECKIASNSSKVLHAIRFTTIHIFSMYVILH